MERIKLKSYGKINLSLDVLGRRENGYHDLVMIMQSVGLYDEVIIERTKESGITIICDTKGVPQDGRNIAYKAADLLIKEFQLDTGICITLNKKIPAAAGMAGGSSNAAAVIKGMNELFELQLTLDDMKAFGVKLGADVPYCLQGGTCLAEGIGEILTVLPNMPDCFIAISNPPYEVSTAEVFNAIDNKKEYKHPDTESIIEGIKEQDISKIARNMGNVLESVTSVMHPDINRIKEIMNMCGAHGSMMTGSGPTVFGIFNDESSSYKAIENIEREKLATRNFVVRGRITGGYYGN
ncbi:MAG: 4-(cytidine 5'-diphospho)-2-C-methyl-D-erythritol kinase [Suipraeoptans sp.]